MSATGERVGFAARARDGRRVLRRALLWASLAANVFFAALVGSHLANRPPPSPGVDGFASRLAAGLPPADAARFRAVLDQERPWYQQAHAAMDGAREQVAAAIAREPYNETDVRARLQDWRARWAESSDRFGDSLLTAVRALSPEGRQRLAATLRQPPHH